MNKTVELVTAWGRFEEKFPEGSIADFCRYHLAQQREEDGSSPLIGKQPGKLIPPIDGQLMILLRRIGKLHIAYTNIALEGTSLTQVEEFGMMVTIHNMQNPKKTEVIYSNILELSSGANMLNRMKAKGLIAEYTDEEDKRSKRLKLTAAGEKTLLKSKDIITRLVQMLFADMEEGDKLLCMRLLSGVDKKFSALYPKQKHKRFDEIFAENSTPR